MSNQCSESQFMKDVAGHEMKVVMDNGVNRHLIFSKGGSSAYYFGLVTWGGHLCIYGDMGTYVFTRLPDMFEFFRADSRGNDRLYINSGYWAEKCVSDSKFKGLTKFDKDAFRAAVVYRYSEWVRSYRDRYDAKTRSDLRQQLRDDVLCNADETEYDAVRSAMDFYHAPTKFRMDDFYESNIREFTYNFIWCLYSIAYGIREYDNATVTA